MDTMLVSQYQLVKRKGNSDLMVSNKSLAKGSEKKISTSNQDNECLENFSEKVDLRQILNKTDYNDEFCDDEIKLVNESEKEYNNLSKELNLIKNKRSNGWFNFLPSYKSRSVEFKKYFNSLIPKEERFVVDYSCVYQREILAHGRMYVSLNHICFYANIFTWETNLVINFENVKDINKTNTAFVFPNAIEIVTKSGKKYTFASFVTREKAYHMIFKIWKNFNSKLYTDSGLENQLVKLNFGFVWDWIHEAYGDDLGYTVEEEAFEKQNSIYLNNIDQNSSSDSDEYQDSGSFENNQDLPDTMNKENIELINANLNELDVSIKSIDKICGCLCTAHEGELIFEETFSLTVDQFFTLIFDNSPFFRMVQTQRKMTELVCSSWEDCETYLSKKRNLRFKLQIDHPLSKYVETSEIQYLSEKSVPGYCYMIKSESENTGIPYSDCFKVNTQWCVAKGNNAKESILKVHVNIEFIKSSWSFNLIKNTIKNSSVNGIQDYCKFLAKSLHNWCKEKSLERRQNVNYEKLSQYSFDENEKNILPEIQNLTDKKETFNLHKKNQSTDLKYKKKCLDQTYSNCQNVLIPRDSLNQKSDKILCLIILVLLMVLLLTIFLYYRLLQIETKIIKYEDEINNFEKTSNSTFNFNENNLKYNSSLNLQSNQINFSIVDLIQNWKQLINKTVDTIKLVDSNLKTIQKQKEEL